MITAIGAMILLLMLFTEILAVGILNMRLMAFDCHVSRMATRAAEEGCITEENRSSFMRESGHILSTSTENIWIKGPEEKQDAGQLMEIRVGIKDVSAVENPGFWKLEGNGKVSKETKRYVYSRVEKEEKEDVEP